MRGVSARQAMWLGALTGAVALSALGASNVYIGASRSVIANGGSGCWDMGPEDCGRFFAILSLTFTVPVWAAIGAGLGFVLRWVAGRLLIRPRGQGPTAHPPTTDSEA